VVPQVLTVIGKSPALLPVTATLIPFAVAPMLFCIVKATGGELVPMIVEGKF
jgi:hypothetical protein